MRGRKSPPLILLKGVSYPIVVEFWELILALALAEAQVVSKAQSGPAIPNVRPVSH